VSRAGWPCSERFLVRFRARLNGPVGLAGPKVWPCFPAAPMIGAAGAGTMWL
jgi:hypothetical protein